jgi:dehydrogenase/reductase SDR family protein 12
MRGKTVLIVDGKAVMSEELACAAASRGARVVLVCSSQDYALRLQQRICATACTLQVEVLVVADLSLVAEAERAIHELREKLACTCLDCIVVNVDGADVSAVRTFTTEGHEATFSKYLLAPFALVTAALPLLHAAADARVVLVSAGVMYTTAFPPWPVACGLEGQHHPVAAHAFARRGQVLLAEAWARRLPQLCVVSCIPGWVRSSAVEALTTAASKSRMGPFRSPAEGAEGITWLMGASREQLQSGGFYLDCTVQPTHLAGAFFTQGFATRNTPTEVGRRTNPGPLSVRSL